jgi:hypothetical protein
VSLNGGSEVWVPDRYKKFEDDTTRTYDAADIARWATSIDKTTGVWNIEMAIYHPHVAAGSRIGFNMGGSMGSEVHDTTAGDAYGYYCWQPSVVDEPFTQPSGVPIPDWGADPGSYILANSVAWAMLEFTPGAGDYVRKVVEVPEVDTSVIQIDGAMDESAWQGAATANLVTSTGFEMFAFPYDRAGLAEPEYDEFVGRMLWSRETLYVFVTVDEFVNDSTDLYWGGQWVGDQLFIGLSSRLGVEMEAWYDGNVYAAPEGPYHFLILGDDISLNGGNETWLPDRYQAFPDDTVRTYNASDIARWATTIDKTTGKWTIEMAIHDPNALAQARTAFNIGGSMGSEVHDTSAGDAYGYYCWQPSVADEPFTQPPNVPIPDWGADPGSYILANSVGWALLEYKSGSGTVNVAEYNGQLVPEQYRLEQNYPNPFNPSTVIGYGIPHQGKVMLTVYNLLGQKVAILADEVKDAGFYHATWNAAHVGTGVYFYELRVDNAIVSTKKMLLTK